MILKEILYENVNLLEALYCNKKGRHLYWTNLIYEYDLNRRCNNNT